MSGPVNVVAVIRKHAESHRASAGSDAYSAQEAPRLEAALAAIEELIAADDECYDAAVQIGECMIYGTEEQKAAAMFRQAKANARHLKALAAVKGNLL